MTVDEIKSQYSMKDILSMYGITPNHAGFIHCPFHQGDRTASMKIYLKDYHCHACGANGDIFTFVRQMENCSFKDAFKRLGGSYEAKSDRERDLFHYKLKKAKESQIRREARLLERKKIVLTSLHRNRLLRDHVGVFTDAWCMAVNGFEKDYIELEEINTELRKNHDG